MDNIDKAIEEITAVRELDEKLYIISQQSHKLDELVSNDIFILNNVFWMMYKNLSEYDKSSIFLELKKIYSNL